MLKETNEADIRTVDDEPLVPLHYFKLETIAVIVIYLCNMENN